MDNGYSIKISMKKNEPPVETFFSYAEDTILSYVENGELPPHILEILDKAEPRLFYNGCVIAEILDQRNGVPGELYRILLRPSNLVCYFYIYFMSKYLTNNKLIDQFTLFLVYSK